MLVLSNSRVEVCGLGSAAFGEASTSLPLLSQGSFLTPPPWLEAVT